MSSIPSRPSQYRMAPPGRTAAVTAAGLHGVPAGPAGPSPLWPLLASGGQLGPGSAKRAPKLPTWEEDAAAAGLGRSAATASRRLKAAAGTRARRPRILNQRAIHTM